MRHDSRVICDFLTQDTELGVDISAGEVLNSTSLEEIAKLASERFGK